MTYKIAIVGNELACTGFELAGVSDAYVATTAEEAKDIIEELFGRGDIGIIGITSKLYKELASDPAMARKLELSTLPMVVELPEYGEWQSEDMLRKLIIRAIGIDLEQDKE
ncbi:MAG: V-type ATP synthase subunit F [Candidatus Micrarchaeia archaeon]